MSQYMTGNLGVRQLMRDVGCHLLLLITADSKRRVLMSIKAGTAALHDSTNIHLCLNNCTSFKGAGTALSCSSKVSLIFTPNLHKEKSLRGSLWGPGPGRPVSPALQWNATMMIHHEVTSCSQCRSSSVRKDYSHTSGEGGISEGWATVELRTSTLAC